MWYVYLAITGSSGCNVMTLPNRYGLLRGKRNNANERAKQNRKGARKRHRTMMTNGRYRLAVPCCVYTTIVWRQLSCLPHTVRRNQEIQWRCILYTYTYMYPHRPWLYNKRNGGQESQFWCDWQLYTTFRTRHSFTLASGIYLNVHLWSRRQTLHPGN